MTTPGRQQAAKAAPFSFSAQLSAASGIATAANGSPAHADGNDVPMIGVLTLAEGTATRVQQASVDEATSTTTALAARDWKTYANYKYGFSFDYRYPFKRSRDVDWAASSGSSRASAFVFNHSGPRIAGEYREAFGVNVYQLNTVVTKGMFPQVRRELKGVLRELRQQDPSLRFGYLRRASVSSLDGFAVPARYKIGDTAMKTRMYFVFDGRLEYQLLEQTTDDRWYGQQSAFRSMRGSFESF